MNREVRGKQTCQGPEAGTYLGKYEKVLLLEAQEDRRKSEWKVRFRGEQQEIG